MPEQSVQVLQSAIFARAYKRLHKNQKVDVDTAIEVIVKSPEVGELKRGDLAGVYVYNLRVRTSSCFWRMNTIR